MRAICVDGTEVECGNFKAVDGGVVLTADEKRKTVVGFVPTANLSYILPDDVAAERTATAGESEAASVPVVESADDAGSEDGTGEADDIGGSKTADTGETGNGGDSVSGLVAGAPESTRTDPDEDLRRLVGLGDTYVERLREAGIETVSDLRRRSVDEVADAARAPRGRAERWLRLVTPRDGGAGADASAGATSAEPSDTEASEPR
jgi:predicted flap endonuclease-1-like 5' DNA nuclease